MNKKIITVSLVPLLIFVVFAGSTTSKTLETLETNNNYAVVIGIPQYTEHGGFNDQSAILFKNSINSKGFYTEVKTLGIACYDFDNVPPYHYQDHVSKDDIEDSIEWLYEKSQLGDCTLLFYYNGHGSETHITTSTSKVSHTELKEWFEKFNPSDKLVLIFETCHGGNLTENEKSKDTNDNFRSINYLKTKFFKIFSNFFPRINRISQEKLNINSKEYVSGITTTNNNVKTSQDYSETPSDFRFTNLVNNGRIIISACKKKEAAWHYDFNDFDHDAVTFGAFTNILCDKLSETDYIEPAFNDAYLEIYFRVLKVHWHKQHPQMVDNIDGDVKIK